MSYHNLNRLKEIIKLFLKLGTIGFGGPAAHIAMMEEEVVKRRGWLTRSHFLDLIGATNLIPGPNSTEMAIHVGYSYGGWLGLILAGVCFILPAVLITAIFAWIYVQFGTLPQVAPFIYGIKPAIIAVILGAVWRLGKKGVKNQKLLVILLGVANLLLFGVNEIVALLLGGIIGMIWLRLSSGKEPPSNQTVSFAIASISTGAILKASAATGVAGISVPLWQLGWFFLKVGSVLFGSGYVLVAFLEGGLVQENSWLTQQQLLDAIAIGQFTPGPVLSTATFIGYLIAGLPGAIVATIAIFFPSFLFVALLNPLIPRLRESKWASAFLDAVNVSSIALMGVVTVNLAITTFIQGGTIDWRAGLIAIISAILTLRFSLNSAFLVLGGAILGWLTVDS
ncbi:MAG TPA: chromate transporter [Cyanobacteria bacterium UBA11149]|nr:chromate transporter [Cyanobacteria bacterium UBA11367]HBE59520.1 chromate transporter [Cyanobacteria bacterium UBA11366]HBK66533.1 chromate transporter [Cyanobacteria bacterium UBA11166]HBR75778.1 chromate transporter [Cyanobacteria bacterium UBA11159]HBS68202.1 chromate transporter [Cyanobacteria bacterium UBA11153]HBW90346.1 chromate transporter [Cyanobacteria bacterium UBA11149]HCA94792.1 chromate transporter [Cyanobacteria bacterium UBA9226]